MHFGGEFGKGRILNGAKKLQVNEAFLHRFDYDVGEKCTIRAERIVYDLTATRRLRPKTPSVPRTKRPAPN